jgi:hypothetical protein
MGRIGSSINHKGIEFFFDNPLKTRDNDGG